MPLKTLDVQAWRAATNQEILQWMKARGKAETPKPSLLAVRTHLVPVDIYCYLKARFGEPNGFQDFLRRDDSDNWIHWDFLLKSGDQNVYICGTSRETHIILSEQLTDADWRDLIKAIKADYGRVGKQKSAVFKSLERWVIFPNRFIEVANVCADLHATITQYIDGFRTFKTSGFKTEKEARKAERNLRDAHKRISTLYRACLQLSLLTPVLAESFINMLILILCKQDVRRNKRHFEAFIRSNIDVKIFDLSLKCEGFARGIDTNSDTYKKFKQVMDRRNDIIHGNANPEAEQLEALYFEGKRPLFKQAGDHIAKFQEALERQYQPELVLRQYLDTYAFLLDVVAHLKPGYVKDFWRIMEDNYPGYDLDRHITGALFPGHVMVATFQGLRYDDELKVT